MVRRIRLLLALVGGVTGYEVAVAFLPDADLARSHVWAARGACVVVGIVLGVVLGGFLGRAVTKLGRRLDRASSLLTASGLIFTSLGLLIGLAIAALGGLAVKDLPVVGLYLLPLALRGERLPVRVPGLQAAHRPRPGAGLQGPAAAAGGEAVHATRSCWTRR